MKSTAAAGRTVEQIREHYDIEVKLAERLRNANKEQRSQLYSQVYNELFQRVPHHPMLLANGQSHVRDKAVSDTIRFLRHFLLPQSTFLEIGCGDCKLAFQAATLCRKVYAVDVSVEIMSREGCPANCHLLLSDGCRIPVPSNSVDVAYSKDVIEHLHPHDALEQTSQIHQALVPGGIFICRTPNAISGPHDVSGFFNNVPTGLHLKEYTTTELLHLFKLAGFSRVYPYVWARDVLINLPMWTVVAVEGALGHLPRRFSRACASRSPLQRALSRVIAVK